MLDVLGGRLIVQRKPIADGYAERREFAAGDVVTATAVALPPLALGELLTAAASHNA